MVALVWLSSCAASKAETQGAVRDEPLAPGDLTSPSTVPDLNSLSQPYELITLTSPEQLVAFQAGELLIEECMVARGFDYASLPPPDFDAIRRSQQPLTRDQLAVHGFVSQRANFSGFSPEELKLQRLFGENPAFATAYFGAAEDGNDGCYVPSQVAVFGADAEASFSVLQQMVENKVAAFRKVAVSSEEYLDLEERWVRCMADAGYNFPSSSALREVEWSPPRPGSAEVATALQDFDCRASLGFDEFLEAEISKPQGHWLDADPGLLEALRSARQRLYENSVAVLAG